MQKYGLNLAEEEFKYALGDLAGKELISFAQTCFHFQQAAEKYLKSFILAKGLTFRKVHNLVELVKVCAKKDLSFREILEEAAFLNPFYTDTRYPIHWPMVFTRGDAEKAKEAVEEIRELVQKKIKKK